MDFTELSSLVRSGIPLNDTILTSVPNRGGPGSNDLKIKQKKLELSLAAVILLRTVKVAEAVETAVAKAAMERAENFIL
jgi:hypothetical protein